MINKQSEIQLQAKCFQWFHNTYPNLRGCLFSVPNGGYRKPVEAMQLKASGMVPGIPDMVLLAAGRAYGFEMKTATGKLSPEQAMVHGAWLHQGVTIWVIRDFEYFKGIVSEMIIQPNLGVNKSI